ncbi:MAG: cytochrome C biosynthesis protein, partial [Desulfobacterales bacterium]|nr:cytochrome C biosynthesis protein [Desulfobacterales bacterium]
APILAIITIQQKVATGILFILLFAVGHCLPIVVAGSSAAVVRKLMENSAWQGAGTWFRKGAGIMIGLLGIYFVISPFVGT